MMNLFKEMMATGLGAVFFTKDKIEEMVEDLVEEGKVSRNEATQLVDEIFNKAKEQREEMVKRVKVEVENNLERAGLARKEEVKALQEDVSRLELQLEAVERELEELKGDNQE